MMHEFDSAVCSVVAESGLMMSSSRWWVTE